MGGCEKQKGFQGVCGQADAAPAPPITCYAWVYGTGDAAILHYCKDGNDVCKGKEDCHLTTPKGKAAVDAIGIPADGLDGKTCETTKGFHGTCLPPEAAVAAPASEPAN